MAEELRLASNVQRSLMPPPLQHARLEVAREFIPFREIGGDFYDFVPLGPHRMAFAIGDVMGKGVPAALLAANLKALIRAQIEPGDVCPAALVTKVNRLFWDVVPTGLFASLFFTVFDLEKGTADYVNAGHHHPFLVPPRARSATWSRAVPSSASPRTRPTSRARSRWALATSSSSTATGSRTGWSWGRAVRHRAPEGGRRTLAGRHRTDQPVLPPG